MEILMCEECGQRFNKVSVLYWHQRATHYMEFKQFHKNTELNIAFFSNWGGVSNCGGGEPGGGFGGEIRNGLAVDQSWMINFHQTFSESETLIPPSSMSAKEIDDYWEATMTAYAIRQQQINRSTNSQGSNIVRQLNTTSLDARAKEAMMRIRSSCGARVSSSAMLLNFQSTTDDPQTAHGGIQPYRRVSTSYIPKQPAVLHETKHVAGTQQQAPSPNVPDPAISAVSEIMKSLETMKSLNNRVSKHMDNSTKFSLSQSNSGTYSSVAAASTPTVSPPTSRSELEHQGHYKVVMYVKDTQTNEVKSGWVLEDFVQPAKTSIAAAENDREGEKAQTQNKTLLHNNSFLTSQPYWKRGKSIPSSPNHPFSREVFPSTSSVMETNTKSATAAATPVSAPGRGGKLVAKAATSAYKARVDRGNAPPQKTNLNHSNVLHSIQPSAKNNKKFQKKGKSTTLTLGRVVIPTSSKIVSMKKSAVACAACYEREVVAKKLTVPKSPKKQPPLPKTTKKGTLKVTLAKLKKIVPIMPGTDYIMPKSGAGSYTDKWGKNFWICQVCNQAEPEKSSKDMICCDKCKTWYHFECVGIMADVAEDDPWYCKICIYKVCGNKKGVFQEMFKND